MSLELVAPHLVPSLDPGFRPAVLANRAYRRMVADHGAFPIRIGCEINRIRLFGNLPELGQ